MIDALNPYPAYKPSGIEWLGDVPAHWDVRRLASCIDQIQSGAREQSEVGFNNGVPNLGGEHIGADNQLLLRNMRYVSCQFFENLRKGVVQQDDILLVKDGATIGKVAFVREMPYEKCSINEHVYIIRPTHNILSPLLFYNIRSSGIQDSLWQEVTGSAQPGLNSSFTKSLSVALPPLPEQTAIARFLDHADRRIRRYIRAKEKLIALLEEERQAVISEAVTGRIDVRTGQPYPAYKPSGVEWLGDVPAHWEVVPNRAIFTEVNERGHSNEQMLSVTITRGVICQQVLLEDSSQKDASRLDRSTYKLVQPGDIAYNKMRAWQGAIGVSVYRGIVSPAYVVQRPRNRATSRYMHHLLRMPAFALEAQRWSYGIASDMWSLRPEHFKMIYSCLPPLPEQAVIVEHLDKATAEIAAAITRARRQIELLQEYRTRLIADVVTGKLDVRKAPAPHLGGDRSAETLNETDILNNAEEGTEAMED